MLQKMMMGIGIAISSIASAGPDLICSEINGSTSFGVVDGIAAYSFGTTMCNIGDASVMYNSFTNQHPLIAQSIYKLKNNRIEQIGIGFVRHTNFPLASNFCNLGCTPAGIDALGIGCSDTNSSSANGIQADMGPRTEVNAQTGEYPYPFTSINQSGDAIYKRVQVSLADISDPDALYFVETQLIVPDEETPEARNNNVSYRQVQFSPGTANATLVGPTYTQQPAVFAWRDHGNGIGVPDGGVMVSSDTTSSGGRIHVLSRASLVLGSDIYQYDHVLYNQNSDDGIFRILHSVGHYGDAHGFEFQAPVYHSDLDGKTNSEPWDVDLFECNTLLYRFTDIYNPLGPNTVRWGTAYRLSFSTESNPDFKTSKFGFRLTIGEPNNAEVLYIPAHLPAPGEFCIECPGDLNGDGELNFFDLSLFIQDYNAGGDYNGDGDTNFFDVSQFVQDYSAGCP